MIGDIWRKLFGSHSKPERKPLERWSVDHDGPIYAIGDVHGHLDLLKGLEQKLFDDGARFRGRKLIIMLGDFIDRGPHSAQVLDHLMAPMPSGWQRLSLAGNHEITMIDAFSDHKVLGQWLGFGGLETLASYGIGHDQLKRSLGNRTKSEALLRAHIPNEHIGFLKKLPVLINVRDLFFCHAGPRPDVGWDGHSDDDLLWYAGPRDDTNTRLDGNAIVVHGHVPVQDVEIWPTRINVDTGVYVTGRLSAVRLLPAMAPHVLAFETDGLAA